MWQSVRRRYDRLRLDRLEDRITPAVHDTLATAIPLTFDNNQQAQIAGLLSAPNQVDVYAVQLDAGDEVTANVSAQTLGSPDGALRVFNSAGNQIAFREFSGNLNGDPKLTFGSDPDADGSIVRASGSWINDGFHVGQSIQILGTTNGNDGVDVIASISTDGETLSVDTDQDVPLNSGSDTGGVSITAVNTSVTFDALTPGSYFVGVSSNGNFGYDPNVSGSGSGGLTSGAYNLTLNDSTILVQENGANFTLATAQLISGNVDPSITGYGVVQGSYVTGDTEYYTFRSDVTGGLAATVTPGDGTVLVPRLTLFNAEGQLLIQSDTVDAGSGSVGLNQNLQPGTYTLAVSAAADSGDPTDDQSYLLATKFTTAQPLFQPLSVGTNPKGIVVADLNHDGNADIITADLDASDPNDNSVSVVLGNGDGTFQPAVSYSVMDGTMGMSPLAVEVGDFRGDGNLDIVTANKADNTVSVLLGNGDGTFQPAVTYTVGSAPVAVAVGNFDGHFDIVTANKGANTVSLLLGNGDGTFRNATSLNVGNTPLDVEVGKFNGHADIVTTNANYDTATSRYAPGTVSVLLGKGDGTFENAASYTVGTDPFDAAVGDIDGRPGIVTANFQDNTVSVLLGNSDGTFQQPAATYAAGINPSGVTLGQLDGDGNLDIVATNQFSNSVSVLLGKDDGTFQPAATYPVGYSPFSVALGDFSNDGKLDMAVSNDISSTVSVLEGNGAGGFVLPPTLAVGQRPYSVAVGDLRNDGNPDIVTANDGDGTVSVSLGNGDGTFQSPVTYAVGFNPGSVALKALTPDGNLDIVTSNFGSNSVSVLLGRGDGTFLPAVSYPVGNTPSSVAVGDFNGDGNADIVTANSNPDTVSVLLGKGDGTFGNAVSYPVGSDPQFVAVGDFFGHLDIVTANTNYDSTSSTYGPGTISVLPGKGDGTFLSAVTLAVGKGPDGIAVGKFAGRNDDIVANNFEDNTVSVILGDGHGDFQPAVAYATDGGPDTVAVGQFTGDGHLDVITGNYTDNTVSLLLGNGNGAFQPAVTETVGDTPQGIAVGDFNKDGNLDFVTADLGTNTLSVLLGSGQAPFQTSTTYSLGDHSKSVAVGYDINQDDVIATANPLDNTASVLVGNADGTAFQPTTATYPVGKDPVAVASGNDSQGNVIFVTANYGDNSVSVLPGNVVDTFAPATPYSVQDGSGNGSGPVAVAVGSDTNNDVVIVTANSLDGTVSVLVGDQDGTTFAPAVTYPVGNDPDGIAVDNDDDGNLDIFVANYKDDTVSVLLGDANDNFTPGGTYSVGKGPVALSEAFDANGDDVIATANSLDNTVSVLVGTSDGTMFQSSAYPVGNDPDAVAVGTDSNNFVDVVAANYRDNTVSLLLGNADHTFLPAVAYKVGPQPVSVAVANDFNGSNGNLDIVAASAQDSAVSVLQGNTLFFPASAPNSVPVRNLPYLQDLTGAKDSKGNPIPDELILDGSGNLLFRKGEAVPGEFAPFVTINPNNPANDAAVFQTAKGWAVAAIDKLDDTVSIYTWSGADPKEPFQRTVGFAAGSVPVRIAAADLTGDGRLDDLVVANDSDNTLTIAFFGEFNTPLTVPVGGAPSNIAFANLTGSNGSDILVSDQASGDFSVLFNDATSSSLPTFGQQYRYRAGSGLFDIDAGDVGAPTVLSQLQTVGVAVGNFTGSGNADLVVLNRGVDSFTLLPNQGQGIFTDPLPGNTYTTSDQASQITSLTLPGDALASVAVLMEDQDQIWLYRNNGSGGFAAPMKIDAGNAPTNFSVVTDDQGQVRELLVGNAFGDILTLVDNGQGDFVPDRTDLQNVPLAVGTVPVTKQQYVVVADQDLDKVSVFYRVPGTQTFANSPIAINSQTHPLLAPGAVQLFTIKPDPNNPYLVVANSLSNDVLIYHYDPVEAQYDPPTSYQVGDDPVSVTVADVNGDGVPDVLVPNHGSNDVSVLIGAIDPATKSWVATPYQRLSSDGSGPIAVAVTNANSAHGPDLVVTNSDGNLATIPGVGTGGKGSGFFASNDSSLVTVPGNPIGGVNGGFVATSQGIFDVNLNNPVNVFRSTDITAFSVAGDQITVGFGDGKLEEFTTTSEGLAPAFTFDSGLLNPSALQEVGQDIYVTSTGQDRPFVFAMSEFIPVPESRSPFVPPSQTTNVDQLGLTGTFFVAVIATNPEAETRIAEATLGESGFGVGVGGLDPQTAATLVTMLLSGVNEGAEQNPGDRKGVESGGPVNPSEPPGGLSGTELPLNNFITGVGDALDAVRQQIRDQRGVPEADSPKGGAKPPTPPDPTGPRSHLNDISHPLPVIGDKLATSERRLIDGFEASTSAVDDDLLSGPVLADIDVRSTGVERRYCAACSPSGVEQPLPYLEIPPDFPVASLPRIATVPLESNATDVIEMDRFAEATRNDSRQPALLSLLFSGGWLWVGEHSRTKSEPRRRLTLALQSRPRDR